MGGKCAQCKILLTYSICIDVFLGGILILTLKLGRRVGRQGVLRKIQSARYTAYRSSSILNETVPHNSPISYDLMTLKLNVQYTIPVITP